MKPEKEFIEKNGKHILKIFQDSDPRSPDEDAEDIFLVYEHRQFQVDREGFKPREIFDYLNYPEKPTLEGSSGQEDYEYALEEWENNKDFSDFSDYHIFTVYAYIHSGVSLSLGHNGDRFDTSSTGFILVKKDILKGSSKNEEELTREEAIKYAESVIEEWNTYLSGDVYGFEYYEVVDKVKQLTDLCIEQFKLTRLFSKEARDFAETVIKDILSKNLSSTTEEIKTDSCWGFYGSENDYKDIFDHLGIKQEDFKEI